MEQVENSGYIIVACNTNVIIVTSKEWGTDLKKRQFLIRSFFFADKMNLSFN